MNDKPVALITGANQGIGFQIAKELVSHGFTVLVGSRNVERGEAAATKIGPEAHALQLDVTDQESINAAAERIRTEFGRLDVLVNNAAISNTGMTPGITIEEYAKSTRPSTVSIDEMREIWETNVFGVLAVYQAMVPLLRQAPAARIVNVSSGAGSLTINSDPNSPLRPTYGPGYAASKTALNALTLAMAIELETESRCASRCLGRMVQPGRSRAGKTKRSRGSGSRLKLLLFRQPKDQLLRWSLGLSECQNQRLQLVVDRPRTPRYTPSA
jgi:NAD(P)-dependent dehydrogenase (short-subunit alcohol dehydrogenase family)